MPAEIKNGRKMVFRMWVHFCSMLKLYAQSKMIIIAPLPLMDRPIVVSTTAR